MDQQLKFELYGVLGEGRWFYLYDCPHITNGEFPIALCVCIGPNHNLLLCRHCWQQMKGLAAEEMLIGHFQSLPWTTKPMAVHRLLHPDDKRKDHELIAEVQGAADGEEIMCYTDPETYGAEKAGQGEAAEG